MSPHRRTGMQTVMLNLSKLIPWCLGRMVHSLGLSSVLYLKLPTHGTCFDYLKISAYLDYDRGSTIFLLQARPTHQTTQEQKERVERVGFTFYTEHRVLGCFLLNSFRLGWDGGTQERWEISETENTDRVILNKDRGVCEKWVNWRRRGSYKKTLKYRALK